MITFHWITEVLIKIEDQETLELELNIAIFVFISTGATFKPLKALWTTKILVLSLFSREVRKKILHVERVLVFYNPFTDIYSHT